MIVASGTISQVKTAGNMLALYQDKTFEVVWGDRLSGDKPISFLAVCGEMDVEVKGNIVHVECDTAKLQFKVIDDEHLELIGATIKPVAHCGNYSANGTTAYACSNTELKELSERCIGEYNFITRECRELQLLEMLDELKRNGAIDDYEQIGDVVVVRDTYGYAIIRGDKILTTAYALKEVLSQALSGFKVQYGGLSKSDVSAIMQYIAKHAPEYNFECAKVEEDELHCVHKSLRDKCVIDVSYNYQYDMLKTSIIGCVGITDDVRFKTALANTSYQYYYPLRA